MLQQRQDNMLQDDEVVIFGQRVQQPQDQQQLPLRQHNISHNLVYPKQKDHCEHYAQWTMKGHDGDPELVDAISTAHDMSIQKCVCSNFEDKNMNFERF